MTSTGRGRPIAGSASRSRPEATHPFGTKNALVQLGGAFLELVAIGDPAVIPEPTPAFFSFAAFNRDFLERREGLSMLALKSRDANIDYAEFASRGLPTYEPVRFERTARGPDGVERMVAFTMNFTGERRIRDAGFFTCQHHFPENFWRAEYQRHDNGAERIASVVMIARDPADFHEFLTYFTGKHDMLSTSLGIEIDTGEGKVEVLSPVGFAGSSAVPRRWRPTRNRGWSDSDCRSRFEPNARGSRFEWHRLRGTPWRTGRTGAGSLRVRDRVCHWLKFEPLAWRGPRQSL